MFMLLLFTGLVARAQAPACAALLSDLHRVRRAGERVFGRVRIGQIVNLGSGAPREAELQLPADEASSTLTVRTPYPVKLLALGPGGRARVQLLDGAREEFDVPMQDLETYADLAARTIRLNLRRRALRGEAMTFAVGERVRVRVDGLMTTGLVTAPGADGVIGVDQVARPVDEVFKLVAPHPRSLVHPLGARGMLSLPRPTGVTLAILNQAQITDGRGRRETWVIEASCRPGRAPGAWRRRDLKRRPTTLTARFYMQPDRTVELESPGWR